MFGVRPGGNGNVSNVRRVGDEREVLRPVANRPYRRLGVQPAAEPTRRRVPEALVQDCPDSARVVVADQLARSTLLADNLRVKSKVSGSRMLASARR